MYSVCGLRFYRDHCELAEQSASHTHEWTPSGSKRPGCRAHRLSRRLPVVREGSRRFAETLEGGPVARELAPWERPARSQRV